MGEGIIFVLALCGCLQAPPEAKPVALGTHVADWRDEVLYQVLVDRFADGDVNNDFNVSPDHLSRYQGGDWRGLKNRLDYLQTLGVTTIWISPVVRNVETDADFDGYHGYWAQDLEDANPHFGDVAELRALVEAAHGKNIKVVLDIVTNHMGQVFFYDMNLNGRPDEYIGGTGSTSDVTRISEFDPDFDPRGVQVVTSLGVGGRAPLDFFDLPSIYREPPKPAIFATAAAYHGFGRTLDYAQPDQLLHGDFPGGLKDVATENPEVRAAMIDSYARWAELVDLDGFRIDTVKHVEHEFWQTFAPGVRERLSRQGKDHFLMFGEAFDGDDQLLGSFTVPGELDSVFYFSQRYAVFGDVFEKAHDPSKQAPTRQIQQLWAARQTHWSDQPQAGGIGLSPQKLPVNFIDNHDVARFLFTSKGDVAALRNALTLLLTEEGLPCVYYGTEQEFSGGNDPANREVMWTHGFDTTGETFTHLSRLTALRKKYVALRRGDTKVLLASDHTGAETDAGLFAFERTGGDAASGYALVVLNSNSVHASSASVTTSLPAGTVLVDVLSPLQPHYTLGAGGALDATVAAQSAMVLVPFAQLEVQP